MAFSPSPAEAAKRIGMTAKGTLVKNVTEYPGIQGLIPANGDWHDVSYDNLQLVPYKQAKDAKVALTDPKRQAAILAHCPPPQRKCRRN